MRIKKSIPPSQAPETMHDRFCGCLAIEKMLSLCPVKAPAKGFANTFSNFVSFKALTYSVVCENGCKTGSLFLKIFNLSVDRSFVKSDVFLDITLTFFNFQTNLNISQK